VEPPPPCPSRARRLLLVEDDAVVASVVRELLENAGHHVDHAPHGLAALAMLEGDGYDLLLLDLDLPGLDGLALSRLLRDRGDDTPRIALTARADATAAAHAAGMTGFLRKPITATQLLEAVETWGRDS
jgi:CheY-like chemotaxis protein